MSNMGSSTVYERAPGESTEWEDIQRRLGNMAPAEETKKPEPEPEPEPVDKLESKTLEDLSDLDDDDEFADTRVLEEYRAKRIAELKAKAAAARFGGLKPITRDEWAKEINEASKECPVVVLLHQDHVEDSVLLKRAMTTAANKNRHVKFVTIKADLAAAGFPDKHVPTVSVYKGGEKIKDYVNLVQWGGKAVSPEAVEYTLAQAGVLETDIEDDPRVTREAKITRLRGRPKASYESDSD